MTRKSKPNILVIWGDDVGIWNIRPITAHGELGLRY
jgi:hypothetical protein